MPQCIAAEIKRGCDARLDAEWHAEHVAMTVDPLFVDAIRALIDALVEGRYDALALADETRAQDVAVVIRDYGRTLVAPPPELGDFVMVWERDGDPDQCLIDAPLWTREEGRSDLELRLNARRTRTGYDVRLYDVLVP